MPSIRISERLNVVGDARKCSTRSVNTEDCSIVLSLLQLSVVSRFPDMTPMSRIFLARLAHTESNAILDNSSMSIVGSVIAAGTLLATMFSP